MQSKLLSEIGGQRSHVLVLATGEEAMAALQAFARELSLTAASFTAIGAFSNAVLGYFDWTAKSYRRIPVDEQVEVASLTGDIALGPDGAPALHAHVVLGRHDGSALAGTCSKATSVPRWK